MLFNLNRNLKASLLVVTILSIFFLSLAGSNFQPFTEDYVDLEEKEQSKSFPKTKLTSTLSNSVLEKANQIRNSYSPKAITPTSIIRGNWFLATGRLEDPDTGIGLEDEPIEIFWSTVRVSRVICRCSTNKNDVCVYCFCK